jgi:hypothetical protein
MRIRYEVRSANRLISLEKASTAQEAVIEYLRSIGCRDDEIVRVAANAAAWRGAVYRALPASAD